MPDEKNAPPEISIENLSKAIKAVEEQNMVLLQQITDLSMTVYSQSDQINATEKSVLKELKKFQTGGPQRAMASLFHKLFREPIEHVNRLDDLLELSKGSEKDPWIESIAILQSHFETILSEWGLTPIIINEGQDQFDPEIHEAADSGDLDIPDTLPANTIVKVKRRGWTFLGTVLQSPQVHVS